MANNDQERRTMLAIVLCMGVYFFWTAYFMPPAPEPDMVLQTDAGEPAPTPTEVGSPSATQAQGSEAGLGAANTLVEPAGAQPLQDNIPPVTTPVSVVSAHSEEMTGSGWSGEIHSANGAIRLLDLTDFTAPPVVTPIWTYGWEKIRGTGDGEGWEPYVGGDDIKRLLGIEGNLVLAGTGSIGDDGAGLEGGPNVYTVRKASDGSVTAQRRMANGLLIDKTYRAGPDPFTVDISVTFTNRGSTALPNLWVGIAERMGDGNAGRFDNVVRPLLFAEDDLETILDLEDVEGTNREEFGGPVEWFGVGDRYFMTVAAPKSGPGNKVVVDATPGNRVGSFMIDAQPLDAGASRTIELIAYAGPKNLDSLKPLGHRLEEAVEFGWFGFFAKILLFMLKLFQAGVVNWGWSIILLTLVIKVLFFPLTQKSFQSSRRMQALQPQLKELKEKYKDNKELQTQETMRIFKDNNVNPMGGCLPTLIQLPVWFSLYYVMLNSAELYDTSFLYLKDLTEADPYGLLPTVYAIAMILQQRLMPMAGMDPTQAKIMKMMPLFFAFLFYSFPSGLVLYFSVNILLTALQQWLINRRFDKEEKAA